MDDQSHWVTTTPTVRPASHKYEGEQRMHHLLNLGADRNWSISYEELRVTRAIHTAVQPLVNIQEMTGV